MNELNKIIQTSDFSCEDEFIKTETNIANLRIFSKKNESISYFAFSYENVNKDLIESINQSIENPDFSFLQPLHFFTENEGKNLTLIYNKYEVININDKFNKLSLDNIFYNPTATNNNLKNYFSKSMILKVIYYLLNALTSLNDKIDLGNSLIVIGKRDELRIIPFFCLHNNDSNIKKFMCIIAAFNQYFIKYNDYSKSPFYTILQDYNECCSKNLLDKLNFNTIYDSFLKLFQNNSFIMSINSHFRFMKMFRKKMKFESFQTIFSLLDDSVSFLRSPTDVIYFITLIYMSRCDLKTSFFQYIDFDLLELTIDIAEFKNQYKLTYLTKVQENRIYENALHRFADIDQPTELSSNYSGVCSMFQNSFHKTIYYFLIGTNKNSDKSIQILSILKNSDLIIKNHDIINQSFLKKIFDETKNSFEVDENFNYFLLDNEDILKFLIINILFNKIPIFKIINEIHCSKSHEKTDNNKTNYNLFDKSYKMALSYLNELNDKNKSIKYLKEAIHFYDNMEISLNSNNKIKENYDDAIYLLYNLTKNKQYLKENKKKSITYYKLYKLTLDKSFLKKGARFKNENSLAELGFLDEAASFGNPMIMFINGCKLIESAKNDQKSKESKNELFQKGLYFLKKAADSRSSSFLSLFQYEYANALSIKLNKKEKNFEDFFNEYKSYMKYSSDLKYPIAMNRYALIIKDEKNEEYQKLLKESASYGVADSYYQMAIQIGQQLLNQEPSNKEERKLQLKKIISYIKVASKFGSLPAKYQIAMMKIKGLYFQKDPKAGFSILEEIEIHNSSAQIELAKRNFDKETLISMHNQGFIEATYILAQKLIKISNDKISFKEGKKYMKKCFEYNYKRAKYFMGIVYFKERKYEKSFKFFESFYKETNDEKALKRIGFMMLKGQGTVKDSEGAIKILNLLNDNKSKITLAKIYLNRDPSYSLELVENIDCEEANYIRQLIHDKQNSEKSTENKSIGLDTENKLEDKKPKISQEKKHQLLFFSSGPQIEYDWSIKDRFSLDRDLKHKPKKTSGARLNFFGPFHGNSNHSSMEDLIMLSSSSDDESSNYILSTRNPNDSIPLLHPESSASAPTTPILSSFQSHRSSSFHRRVIIELSPRTQMIIDREENSGFFSDIRRNLNIHSPSSRQQLNRFSWQNDQQEQNPKSTVKTDNNDQNQSDSDDKNQWTSSPGSESSRLIDTYMRLLSASPKSRSFDDIRAPNQDYFMPLQNSFSTQEQQISPIRSNPSAPRTPQITFANRTWDFTDSSSDEYDIEEETLSDINYEEDYSDYFF